MMVDWALGATVKVSAILVVLTVADALCGRRRAAWRNALWKVGVLGALLVPAVGWVLPQVVIPVKGEESVWPAVAPLANLPTAVAGEVAAPLPAPSIELTSPQSPAVHRTGSGMAWWNILTAAYVLGAAYFTVRLALGLAYVARLRRRGQEVQDEAWSAALGDLVARLGIARPVRLLASGELDGPTQVGVWRPVVLVPAAMVDEARARHSILAHELAHVRRWDYAFNVFAGLALAAYWFHPAMWWAVRRLRETGEQACDDWSVELTGGYADYAETLVGVAAGLRGGGPTLGVPMARRRQVAGRVERIVDMAGDVAPRTGRAATAGLVATALLILGVLGAAVLEAEESSGFPEGYPTAVTPQMKEQMAALVQQRKERMDDIHQAFRDNADQMPADERKRRISELRVEKLEKSRQLVLWEEGWAVPKDWAAMDWETRCWTGHAYEDFARDAFNARYIELGLYLTDQALAADPLNGHTYAVRWKMLLPLYAVNEKLSAAQVAALFERDIALAEAVEFAEGMKYFHFGTEEVRPVEEAMLAAKKLGTRVHGYQYLYRWTRAPAHLRILEEAIDLHQRLNGGHSNWLLSLATLEPDPQRGLLHWRRYLAEGEGIWPEQYRLFVEFALAHPGTLSANELEQAFAMLWLKLNEVPGGSAYKQADFMLLRATHAIAVGKDRYRAEHWLAEARKKADEFAAQQRGAPDAVLEAGEQIVLGDLAAAQGDPDAAQTHYRNALAKAKPYIREWTMFREFGMATEVKSLRRRLQQRLDDPVLEDKFYHL